MLRSKPDRIALIALTAMVVIYVLKFFHTDYILQTDGFLNLMLWHYSDWLEPNWDPITLGYGGWYPISAKLFPSVLVLRGIGKFFFAESLSTSLILMLVHCAFAFLLYAFAVYHFLRYFKVSATGALIGSIGVIFGGFIPYSGLRESNYFYSLSAAALFLLLTTIHRAYRERALYWTLVSGLVVGLSLLGGSNFPLFFYLPLFPLVWLMDEKIDWRKAHRSTFRCALISLGAMMIGIAISAFHVLPGLAYLNLSNRGLAVAGISNLLTKLDATSILQLVYVSDESNPNYKLWIFPGLLILAAIGVRFWRRDRLGLRFSFLILAYLGLWLWVGWMPSDFQSLPQVFLGLFSLRMIGVRFAILFLVVVGLWAGRGWDQLGPRIRKAGPFIIAIFFAFYWHNNVDKPLYNYGRIPLSEILNMLRTPPPVLQLDPNYRFLSVPSRRNYWAYEKHIRLAFDPWFDSSGPERLTRFANATTIAPINLEKDNFVSNSPPPYLLPAGSALLDLYNVKQANFPLWTDSPHVLTTSRPFEQAFWTPGAKILSDEKALFDALHNATREELAETVYLEKSSELSAQETTLTKGSAEITIQNRARDYWEVVVSSSQDGFLNISEMWFPAWHAFIDGKEAKLLKGYGTFWTVAVPAGKHRVVFEYREPWWKVGLFVSLVSLALTARGIRRLRRTVAR